MFDLDDATSTLRQRHHTFTRETIPCARNWMAGEFQLACRGKDTQTSHFSFVFRRQHKHGFREIHLARDALHLFVAETWGFGKHCERIAGKRLVGKHVELDEFIRDHELLQSIEFGSKLATEQTGWSTAATR